jgi:hypothetical protein
MPKSIVSKRWYLVQDWDDGRRYSARRMGFLTDSGLSPALEQPGVLAIVDSVYRTAKRQGWTKQQAVAAVGRALEDMEGLLHQHPHPTSDQRRAADIGRFARDYGWRAMAVVIYLMIRGNSGPLIDNSETIIQSIEQRIEIHMTLDEQPGAFSEDSLEKIREIVREVLAESGRNNPECRSASYQEE